jgi:hypothetical protein
MKGIRTFAIRCALVSTVGVVGALTTSPEVFAQAGPPPGPTVTIVNPLPLPVTGSVSLTPGGTVTIGNTVNNPVPVRNVDSAREIFQSATPTLQINQGFVQTMVVTVPTGKRLVIEHVSAFISLTEQSGLNGVSIYKGTSGEVADFLPCSPMGQSPNGLNNSFACSVQTRFHAGPGETVSFSVVTAETPFGGTGRAKGFLSGYFVPAP